MTSTFTTLSRRALNRAALRRQLLLTRSELPAEAVLRHLIGLQAQWANPPYLSLWTRLARFERDDLSQLLHDRRVVRSSMLRGTQHLVLAEDFDWLRPLVQPALNRGRQAAWGRLTAGLDLAELAVATRELLRGRTLTRPQLRKQLAERWPEIDPEALAWSAQCVVPVVHTPPNGTWGKGGAVPYTLAEEWLGRPLAADPSPHELVRRYLAAFGPATVKDVESWSGVLRLAAVLDELRGELVTFRDESGAELFDLPDAPRPDADTPVPVRFLPDFDNLIVAYADRTRLLTDERRKQVCIGAMIKATVLVDGEVAATWKYGRDGDTAILTVEPFEPLSARHIDELTAEGDRLLRFALPDADAYDVRLE